VVRPYAFRAQPVNVALRDCRLPRLLDHRGGDALRFLAREVCSQVRLAVHATDRSGAERGDCP
jgi:hypothetical protein